MQFVLLIKMSAFVSGYAHPYFDTFSLKGCDVSNYINNNVRTYVWAEKINKNFVSGFSEDDQNARGFLRLI
jgi:hypothetical protein